MREVSEGHLTAASPFFIEYKDAPALVWTVGEWLYVLVHAITRLPLEHVLVAAKAVLPAFLFLLVYWFGLRVMRNGEKDHRWPALAAASLVTLAYDPIFSLKGLELSIWTRPVNPIMGALVLFAIFLLLERLLRTKRDVLAIPIGILVGFFVWYPFGWLIASGTVGFAWIIAWVPQRRETLRATSWALAAAVLGSLPYAVYVLTQTGAAQSGSQSAARFGVFFTHMPILNKILLGGTLVFLAGSWWMARTSTWKALVRETWWGMSAAMLLSGWLAFNHQILTGRALWPSHFVQYTKPMVMIIVINMGWRLWPKQRVAWIKALCALAIGLAILNGILWSRSVRFALDDFRALQRYADPLTWLNDHAEAPCVALVAERDEGLTERIPAFTPCDVYTISWIFSGVPDERIRHNFFVRMRLLGLLPEHAREWMDRNPHEVRALFFRDWSDLFAKGTADAWFVKTADALAAEYAGFYAKDFREEASRYRLDYVILENETPYYVLDALGIEDPVQAGSFRIYRFQP